MTERCPFCSLLKDRSEKEIKTKCPPILSLVEWEKFIFALGNISKRDGLIAKVIASTARGLKQVSLLRIEDLDFGESPFIVFFRNDGVAEKVVISSSLSFELQEYISNTPTYRDRISFLFLTNQGKRVFRTHIYKAFNTASRNAGFEFSVTINAVRWLVVADFLVKNPYKRERLMDMMKLKNIPRKIDATIALSKQKAKSTSLENNLILKNDLALEDNSGNSVS